MTTILFSLILLFSSGPIEENSIIEFNGIYQTECEHGKNDNKGGKKYLRFYPNGKIISASTYCDTTPNHLKNWFNMGMKHPNIGDYKIKGRKITFSTTSDSGTVEYKGRITKKGLLKLKLKSLINGYKDNEVYSFIQLGN